MIGEHHCLERAALHAAFSFTALWKQDSGPSYASQLRQGAAES